MRRSLLAISMVTLVAGCSGPSPGGRRITFSGSNLGVEGALLKTQLRRFEAQHPGLEVVERFAPDAADQRHQLYVQWLNARAPEPDVLQLDVIWTPEFAAAGWILPLDRFMPDREAFFPGAIAANTVGGELHALPWFVDVGMLYYRTDLVERAPRSFDELTRFAEEGMRKGGLPYGFVWQGARYEGLVTVFLEHLGGFGGRILDAQGAVQVDGPRAIEALTFMTDAVRLKRTVPEAALTWQEEPCRFAFQNGQAVFMRNWPYAFPLLQDAAQSKVAGKFAVAPMPVEGGRPTAALGGAQLAVNAHSKDPEAAFALIDFLTRPEQQLERARLAGQYPSRQALYQGGALEKVLPIPVEEAARIIAVATPRPVSPIYAQLSELLQVQLHRSLTGQETPAKALSAAAVAMRQLIGETGVPHAGAPPTSESDAPPWKGFGLLGVLLAAAILATLRRGGSAALQEARLGARLILPALATILLIAVFPLGWTFWDSLHLHDLRMPWRGRPFVGLANYLEILRTPRVLEACAHTLLFTLATVTLELSLGLVLALSLNRAFKGRGLVRAAVLVPWAIPTVVAAILWRFMFDAQSGVANAVLLKAHVIEQPVTWFIHAGLAWIPLVLADVWKTTPFVALLLLAGLQGIDTSLYEAAEMDGASSFSQLRHVTLPLLRPSLLIAVLFRTLDALRVFDLVYVLTGGGPGTATEPLSLLTFNALLSDLRFGHGAAMAVLLFAFTLALSLVYLRLLGGELTGERE